MKNALLIIIIIFLTGCVTNPNSRDYHGAGVAIPRDHVRAILSESDSIVDHKVKFYSQSVLDGLSPGLGNSILEFRKEFGDVREKAQGEGVFSPMLVNMPADVLLLRRVVPSSSAISSVQIIGEHTYVTVDEIVLDDGKVYTSSKDRIVFDYEQKGKKWLLSEVFFYRPNTEKTPLLLSQFLKIQVDELGKVLAP